MKMIYILDDDLPILEALSIWFKHKNYEVRTFANSFTFLKSMLERKPSLVIMDINLLTDDGRQLCMLVKAKYRDHLPVILISANPNLGIGFEEYDADAFVAKPFNVRMLSEVVSKYVN